MLSVPPNVPIFLYAEAGVTRIGERANVKVKSETNGDF